MTDSAHYHKTCRVCGVEYLTNDFNYSEEGDCDECFDRLHKPKPSFIQRLDNFIDNQIERGLLGE